MLAFITQGYLYIRTCIDNKEIYKKGEYKFEDDLVITVKEE